jgi:hypothetical protein
VFGVIFPSSLSIITWRLSNVNYFNVTRLSYPNRSLI